MTAAELAERLRARRTGSGWIAKCPAHPDKNPSLSIGEGRDGRVLFHCFAGCTAESVCNALQIHVTDLFGKRGTARKEKPEIVLRAERQIQNLRSRLTPRERALPVTVVFCSRENLDAGIARALALAVEGELVQAVLEDSR